MKWMGAALAIVLAVGGCGDPQTSIALRNEDAADYIVALAEPGFEDIPGLRVIRAGDTRAINLTGAWHGTVGLVEPSTCRLLDSADVNQLDTLLLIRDGRFRSGDASPELRRADEPDPTGGCQGFEFPTGR